MSHILGWSWCHKLFTTTTTTTTTSTSMARGAIGLGIEGI